MKEEMGIYNKDIIFFLFCIKEFSSIMVIIEITVCQSNAHALQSCSAAFYSAADGIFMRFQTECDVKITLGIGPGAWA